MKNLLVLLSLCLFMSCSLNKIKQPVRIVLQTPYGYDTSTVNFKIGKEDTTIVLFQRDIKTQVWKAKTIDSAYFEKNIREGLSF